MRRIIIFTEEEAKRIGSGGTYDKAILSAHLVIIAKADKQKYDVIKNSNGKTYTDVYSYDIKYIMEKYL